MGLLIGLTICHGTNWSRASHVKVSMPVKSNKDEAAKKWGGVPSPTKDGSMERILNKVRTRICNS